MRAAAFWSLVDGSTTACDIYGRQELNKAVFQLDGLDNPKPWQLWERTSQWTLEDATLYGGASGLLLALNPRLLPGATGLTRFLGITVVGCAIGSKTAEWAFGRGPPHQAKRVEWVLAAQRRAMYRRVQEDERARASLSRFARSLLMAYTGDNPLIRILSRPFGGLAGMSNPGNEIVAGSAHSASQLQAMQQIRMQQAHAKQPVLFLTEFDKEELAAPDYNEGYRQYSMELKDTDLEILQEHLDHLDKLRAAEVKELAYLWQGLAQKEHDLYQKSQEDSEKDLLRRELQLLNSIATHSNSRVAVLTFQQADTRKRIGQLQNQDLSSSGSLPLLQIEEARLSDNWTETHSPQRSAERIRKRWEDARADLAYVEHVLAQFDTLKAQGSMSGAAISQAEKLREDAGHMKKNIKATERLLKEYENQIHKADASAGSQL